MHFYLPRARCLDLAAMRYTSPPRKSWSCHSKKARLRLGCCTCARAP